MSYRLERQRLDRQRELDELLEMLDQARAEGTYWYTSAAEAAAARKRSVPPYLEDPQRLHGEEGRDVLRSEADMPASSAQLSGAGKTIRETIPRTPRFPADLMRAASAPDARQLAEPPACYGRRDVELEP